MVKNLESEPWNVNVIPFRPTSRIKTVTREVTSSTQPSGCGICETYACGFHCQKCCKWVFLMTWLKRTACYILSWCFVGCSRNLWSATKYSPRPPPKLLSSHWLLTVCDCIVVRFLVGCRSVSAHSTGNSLGLWKTFSPFRYLELDLYFAWMMLIIYWLT